MGDPQTVLKWIAKIQRKPVTYPQDSNSYQLKDGSCGTSQVRCQDCNPQKLNTTTVFSSIVVILPQN